MIDNKDFLTSDINQWILITIIIDRNSDIKIFKNGIDSDYYGAYYEVDIYPSADLPVKFNLFTIVIAESG